MGGRIMIIESLVIIDYKEKTGTRYNFSNGTNLIVSEGNKKGKSSLLKSMYYTLGFDIRQFPSGWNEHNKIFQLKLKFEDGITHLIQRQGDIYKIDSDDTPLSSKEYSEWLQDSLGINMKLPNIKTNELHSVYSSAIILPFYIDQDDSWDGALYRRVSDSLGQYSNVPKGIFEYLFSISNVEVQELQNKINKFSELIRDNDNTIQNLNKILKKYMNELSDIPEVVELDKQKLNDEINQYLKLINSYNDTSLKYRIKLVKEREKLDFLKNDFDELSNLLKMNQKRHKHIENECKYCHSKLTQEQSLTRLALNNNKFEIIILKDKVLKNIEKAEKEVMELQRQQAMIETTIDDLNNRVKKSKELTTIDEYINARAKTVALGEIEKNIEKERKEKSHSEDKRKEKQREIRQLVKKKAYLKEQITTSFEYAKNKIRLALNLDNSEDFEFLKFKKIDGSGTPANIDCF